MELENFIEWNSDGWSIVETLLELMRKSQGCIITGGGNMFGLVEIRMHSLLIISI